MGGVSIPPETYCCLYSTNNERVKWSKLSRLLLYSIMGGVSIPPERIVGCIPLSTEEVNVVNLLGSLDGWCFHTSRNVLLPL
jgi:hypothetical protein